MINDINGPFLFKPKDRSIKNASKIFFACHPKDFELYFEDITDEILSKTNDNNINAVFCYLNPETALNFDDVIDSLENIQLIVIPVTWDLLLTQNMIKDSLIPFALNKHIPILPLLQDPALTYEYSKHFGNIQFLCNDKNDTTAIPYDVKLNEFIKDTLVGDELRTRVQAAFDAYIFLSYRKKDRKAAQEIMHLIHQNEFCRDIAIWYDEFLTPGEDFNASIKKAIDKSNLFAMVITPNIVEPDNYVILHEYPMAHSSNKTILPLESIETNKDKLSEYYENIPSCTDVHNSAALSEALLRNLNIVAKQESSNSPEHNYLIGLAYLTGIDVEVNHKRGIELIRNAAEANLPEAIERMVTIYRTGIGCDINYNECEFWLGRLTDIYKERYPKYNSDGWLRLMHAYYNKLLLHSSTNNFPLVKSAAEKAIFYAKAVQKEKDIYFVCHVLSFAYITLAGAEQQLLSDCKKEVNSPLTTIQNSFKVALPSLLESEKILESYTKRNPESNCSMLEILTYSQLFSIYSAMRNVEKAKIYFDKLMSIFVKQNNQQLIDELNFQWLLFEKLCEIDLNNYKAVEEYSFTLFEYLDNKEVNNETALAIFQMGYQLCPIAESLLEFKELENGDIENLERFINKCLYSYEQIPKKLITNFILSAASRILLFATTFEKRMNDKQKEYLYLQKYLQTLELIQSRHNTIENKKAVQQALSILCRLALPLGKPDDALEYGKRNHNLCGEIAKELGDDEAAYIECVKHLSFTSYYFLFKDNTEKGLEYAKKACDMAASLCKMFDNSVNTLFNLANVKSDYGSFLYTFKQYTDAKKHCEFADRIYHTIINQNKSVLPVALKQEIIDNLCNNLKLLADIYYEADDTENAEKEYLYFLKIIGDEEEKRDNINDALCRLAEIYFSVDNYEKAEEYIKRLISENPNNEQYVKAHKILKQHIKEKKNVE